jgi:hypothetical protein
MAGIDKQAVRRQLLKAAQPQKKGKPKEPNNDAITTVTFLPVCKFMLTQCFSKKHPVFL